MYASPDIECFSTTGINLVFIRSTCQKVPNETFRKNPNGALIIGEHVEKVFVLKELMKCGRM